MLMTGVSTNLAVEGIVRASVNRGFDMVVVEDCCASYPDEWHRFSIDNIMPLLATVTSSDAVLGRAAGRVTPWSAWELACTRGDPRAGGALCALRATAGASTTWSRSSPTDGELARRRPRAAVPGGTRSGPSSAARATISPRPAPCRTIRHHVTSHRIDVTARDAATGAAYFLVVSDRGPDHWGRYRDRYVTADGAWRFAARRVRVDGWAPDSWAAARRSTPR